MTGSPTDVNSHFTSSPTLYLRARAAATSVRQRGMHFLNVYPGPRRETHQEFASSRRILNAPRYYWSRNVVFHWREVKANKQCTITKNGRKPRQRIGHIHNEILNVTTAAIFKQLSPPFPSAFLHFICAAAIRREILESHDWPTKVARACGNITAWRTGKNVRSTSKDWNLSRFAGSYVQLHMLIRVRIAFWRDDVKMRLSKIKQERG